MDDNRFAIVIGASAGGIRAVTELLTLVIKAKGFRVFAGDYINRANEFESFITVMKEMLFAMNESDQ